MRISNTSERLHQIMEERKLRQVDILDLAKPFCEKYGIKLTKSDVSQYLSKQVEPGREKLYILSLALNVNDAWLMGYDVPKKRNYICSFSHQEHDYENLYAIQVLLKNVGYDFKIFSKQYQIETDTHLIATLSPQDVQFLEEESIDKIRFVADSIINDRFMPHDKIKEDENHNRIITFSNAAHDDEESTPEERKAGDDIMTDDSEWE